MAREGGEIEIWLTEKSVSSSTTTEADASEALAAARAKAQHSINGGGATAVANGTPTGDARGEGSAQTRKRSRNGKGSRRHQAAGAGQRSHNKLTSMVVDRLWTKPDAEVTSLAFITREDTGGAESAVLGPRTALGPTSTMIAAGTLDGELYSWSVESRAADRAAVTIDAGGGPIWGLAVCHVSYAIEGEAIPGHTSDGHEQDSEDGDAAADDDDTRVRDIVAIEEEPSMQLSRGAGDLVAAACDDGGVRVFTFSNSCTDPGEREDLRFKLVKLVQKVKGKALCCEWVPRGADPAARLAVGSSEGIVHVWDYHTNTEAIRLTVGGGPAAGVNVNAASGAAACVWSIAYVDTQRRRRVHQEEGSGDMIPLPEDEDVDDEGEVLLAAGTSDGATSVWDARFGTMVASFKEHESDVVSVAAVAASEHGAAKLFSTGTDNKICMFTVVRHSDGGASLDMDAAQNGNHEDATVNQRDRWVYLGYQRPHSHQVRALVAVPPDNDAGSSAGTTVLSGGSEGCVFMSAPVDEFLRRSPDVMCGKPTPPTLAVVEGRPSRASDGLGGGELLLCQQRTHMDIWQLGFSSPRPNQREQREGAPVDLVAAPSHLARVRSFSGRAIISSAIARDGMTVAYSDTERCCVLRVEYHARGGGSVGGKHATDGQPAYDALKIKKLSKLTSLPRIPASDCLSLPPSRHQSQLMLVMMGDGEIWVIDLHECELMHVFGGYFGATRPGGAPVPHARGPADDRADDGMQQIDRPQDAAAHLMPCPTTVAISPDGQWMAVASRASVSGALRLPGAHGGEGDAGSVQIAVLSLDGLITHKLLRLSNTVAVTAMSFTYSSDVLAVSTLSHDVLLFSVESGKLCSGHPGAPAGVFSLSRTALPSSAADAGDAGDMKTMMRKGRMSAVIQGMCFCTKPGSLAALMYTNDAIVYKNFSHASGRPKNVRGGGGGGGGSESSALYERVLPLEHPCLLVRYLSGQNALLVERAWETALAALPQHSLPAARSKYGT